MNKKASEILPLVKIPVPIQDTYNVEEIAILLGIGKNRVYELARREDDPLPLRRLPIQTRGNIIIRMDLLEWMKRNLPPVQTAHEGGRQR